VKRQFRGVGGRLGVAFLHKNYLLHSNCYVYARMRVNNLVVLLQFGEGLLRRLRI